MYKFFLIVLFSIVVGANGNDKHYIENPKVTDWGTWGKLDSCSEGQYAIGMQLKVEKSDGWKDDTGLNGIRFFCSKLGEGVSGKVNVDTPRITSSVGKYGNWKKVFVCGDSHFNSATSGIIGFQLRSEKNRGRLDDTAANNLRIICADFGAPYVDTKLIEGDGTAWGDWTSVRLCNPGYAICGLKTQVEEDKGSDDDTSLNNLNAECCEVKLEKKQRSSEEDVVTEDKPTRTVPATDFAQSYKEDIERSARARESYLEPVTNVPISTTTITTTLSTFDVSTGISLETTTEPLPPPTVLYVMSTSTEDPTDSSQLTSAEKDDKARYQKEVLAKELSQLAELDFGTSKSTYTVNIPSDEHISIADIQEANPMVPPEVIYIASNAADRDLDDNNDPDPPKVQYISGSIISQTSTAPTSPTTDSSVELNQLTYNQAHCLMPSSLFKVETLSLIAMYCIMRILV